MESSNHSSGPLLRVGLIVALGLFVLSIILVFSGARRPESTTNGVVRIGVIMSPAVDSLEKWWGQDSVKGLENAFCIARYWPAMRYPEPAIADSILRVVAVQRAIVDTSSHDGVSYECPVAMPGIHTHPVDANGVSTCEPTRMDWEFLEASPQPFAVIQCARNAFRWYWRAAPLRFTPQQTLPPQEAGK